MSMTPAPPSLDALLEAQALLEDPAHADNPLRPVVLRLIESIRALEHRLDKISNISDHYQARLKVANEYLTEAAHTDLLTGLANRREMLERLQQEMRRVQRGSQTFSVLEVDVDHFKAINDNYGHIVGDRILASVADRMRETLRGSDLCARWGGEEFLVLLPLTEEEGATTLAERLRRTIAAHPFTTHGFTINLTISIGGMTYHLEHTLDNLLHHTDDMLYRAKEAGRNCVCFAERAAADSAS